MGSDLPVEQDPDRNPRRVHRLRQSVARRGVAVIPTLFTLGNLLCGCAAIFIASRDAAAAELPFGWTPLTLAAALIFAGMLFDGLDGRIARLMRSTSELGGQLDSMSDMVTFGVAPAFLAVQLASEATGVEAPFVSPQGDHLFARLILIAGGIYACCAALRLARFNLENDSADEADHMSFMGLPSPGAAGTIASLILLHEHFLANYPEHNWLRVSAAVAIVAVTALTAIAMVSRFPYVHVMNRYVRNRAKVETVAKAVIVGLLVLIHLQGALAAAFVLYALSAPLASAWRWARRDRRASGKGGAAGGTRGAALHVTPEATPETGAGDRRAG